MRPLSASSRHTTSLNASQSSIRVIRINTTTRGPSTRIQKLLASSLLSYETSKPNIVSWMMSGISHNRLHLSRKMVQRCCYMEDLVWGNGSDSEATTDGLAGISTMLQSWIQRLILREQAPFGCRGVQSPFCSGCGGASPPDRIPGIP